MTAREPDGARDTCCSRPGAALIGGSITKKSHEAVSRLAIWAEAGAVLEDRDSPIGEVDRLRSDRHDDIRRCAGLTASVNKQPGSCDG
jgi:hypothetical protein